MTTAYDVTRFDPAQYDFNIPVRTGRYQRAVYEFMQVVHSDETYLRETPELITAFCNLVDRDGPSFPLAPIMIPEFRKPQSLDTTADTVLNIILRVVVHRRPFRSVDDAANALDRRLKELRVMSRNGYIASSLEGRPTTAQRQYVGAGDSSHCCCEDAM